MSETPHTNRQKAPGKKIRKILLLSAVLFVVLLVSGCGIAALMLYRSFERGGYFESWEKDEGRVLTGLPYGDDGSGRYDLYLHNSIDPDTETPLLLLIHGGGWTSGNRGEMAYACHYYGKNGCITASLDYSLISEKNPEITINTMLDEITACTATLKKQLEAEGYRISGMAIGGISAGGHLSMLYAYSRAKESAIPISFVFQKVGPVMFRKGYWEDDTAAILIGYGGQIHVEPEQLENPETIEAADAISPIRYLCPDSLPTIFAYGDKDNLVWTVHRDALVKALDENHVPYSRIDFPNSGHLLCDDVDCRDKFRATVLQYCERYLKKSRVGEKKDTTADE